MVGGVPSALGEKHLFLLYQQDLYIYYISFNSICTLYNTFLSAMDKKSLQKVIYIKRFFPKLFTS
jgi:hypothetical protein